MDSRKKQRAAQKRALLDYAVRQHITSISSTTLESLCDSYLNEGRSPSQEKFLQFLYENKMISPQEFKRIQTLEKVEVTVVADDKLYQMHKDDLEGQVTHKERLIDRFAKQKAYKLLEKLDKGAMGSILVARDNRLNRTVAYKSIHADIEDAPGYLARFLQEAQITAQLQHPSIVPVYGLIASKQQIGYTMKLIEGVTLKDYIRETQDQYVRQGYPDEHHKLHARLEHFLKVCDAMHYAHRKGIVHRDLKPLNIMIGQYNEVYVMDWGIAKMIDVDDVFDLDETDRIRNEVDDSQTDDSTKMGQILGTPAYMSPEQADGNLKLIDHRSDLYSLGLILFELVTFYRAIRGKTASELIAKAKRGVIDKPPSYNKQADEQEQLLAIVDKATKYEPEERYDTVADFADDIRRFMHGEAIHARPESTRQRIMRWMTHHRRGAVNMMLSAVASVCLLTILVLYQQVNTIKSTQDRDQKIDGFIYSVGQQAENLNAEFLRYNTILEGIKTAVFYLLEQDKSTKRMRYFTDQTIDDKQNRPQDYEDSKFYGYPISIDYHVYVLTSGVLEQNVQDILFRLAPLRDKFRESLLASYAQDVSLEDEVAVRNIIAEEGLPLIRAYVALENGVIADYPGRSGYPIGYDFRKLPWYYQQEGNSDIAMSAPYVDHGNLLLPLNHKVYDTDGQFIGIVGVGLLLDYLRKNALNVEYEDVVDASYLLDNEGHVIVSSISRDADLLSFENYAATGIIEAKSLKIFPNNYIVQKIKQGVSSGYHKYFDNKNNEKHASYYRLDSTDSYFLTVADSDKFNQTKKDESSQ